MNLHEHEHEFYQIGDRCHVVGYEREAEIVYIYFDSGLDERVFSVVIGGARVDVPESEII